ncbi:hypothetical protein [Hyphomonas sp. CY54-11-8]|uniref:hypothetical protein n=1 Tax=Hyphomonas sp. CY54-11-8 TaxID=1280944 RepID=UPI000458F67E|nr:hypothetical protein [Hyphomonas sp. CY54-11-8]KCZ47737.1 hypothetical protein HY17_04475 [Hyphomonas sp. CY54-11-8]
MSHRKDWMTDDQWECVEMLADLFRGFHHIYGPIKPFGEGIAYAEPGRRMATFDFDYLTRAVIMAHDRCIRLEIASCNPGRFRMILHKRHKREGKMHERHPTIHEAVERYHIPDTETANV